MNTPTIKTTIIWIGDIPSHDDGGYLFKTNHSALYDLQTIRTKFTKKQERQLEIGIINYAKNQGCDCVVKTNNGYNLSYRICGYSKNPIEAQVNSLAHGKLDYFDIVNRQWRIVPLKSGVTK